MGKEWTIMVYLAGDNELNEMMVKSLSGLYEHRENKDCKIFAYYATPNPLEPAMLFDFRMESGIVTPHAMISDLEKYKVDHIGTTAATSLSNSADPTTLVSFVTACVQESQTDHYALILSAHSDAFLGRSLFKDETSVSVMKFSQLKAALSTISTTTIGRKLDILGFDSCAMGLIEIAYELRETAEIMVTPQDFTPVTGWDYANMFRSFTDPDFGQQEADAEDKDPDPGKREARAKEMVIQYIKSQRSMGMAGSSMEISALRLNQFTSSSLIGDFSDLSTLLRQYMRPISYPDQSDNFGDDEIGSDHTSSSDKVIFSKMINFILSCHWFSQTHVTDQAVDIIDFCKNLMVECFQILINLGRLGATSPTAFEFALKLVEIFFVCEKIIDEINKIIIKSCHVGAELQYSSGVSVFFPWSRLAFLLGYESYKDLEFNRDTGRTWLSLINRFTHHTMRRRYPSDFFTPAADDEVEMKELEKSDELPAFHTLFDAQRFLNILARLGIQFDITGKFDPPGKGGALDQFRQKFGRVKNTELPPKRSICQ